VPATALAINTALAELCLDNNNIGDEGATVLATTFSVNSTLTRLV